MDSSGKVEGNAIYVYIVMGSLPTQCLRLSCGSSSNEVLPSTKHLYQPTHTHTHMQIEREGGREGERGLSCVNIQYFSHVLATLVPKANASPVAHTGRVHGGG